MHHVVVHAVHARRRQAVGSLLRVGRNVGVVPEEVAEELRGRRSEVSVPPAGSLGEQRLTFLLFWADGLTMVSSGRLGFARGDSHELKKDWRNGSRFWPR